MQTVLLHVTAGARGRCELRLLGRDGWQPVAAHELPADPAPPGANGSVAAAGEIGAYLTRLVLHGDTRRAWEQLRDADVCGLRTLLQVDPPELQGLPWELVGCDTGLFPQPRHVLVRVRDLEEPGDDLDGLRLVPPLRVLVVAEDETAAAEAYRTCTEADGPAQPDIEVLVAPEPGALSEVHTRMRPHVLHVVGRAAERLGVLAAPHARLVVLDRVAGPAPHTAALLDAGACAVLHVPGGSDTARFTARLHAALAAEEPVDVAVALARGTDDGPPPALTVRVHPERVLPFAPLLGADHLVHRTAAGPLLRRVDTLLDRAEAELARGDHAAPDTFEAALRATQGMGPAPEIRVRLARALAWFGRLREASAELRGLLASPPLDEDARRTLSVLAAEVAQQCGRNEAAAKIALQAGDAHRARTVRVRAALAGQQLATALEIATAAAADAPGVELAGATAADLMLLDKAIWLLEEAESAWLGRNDPDGVVRCRARSAVVLMRGYGDLDCAAERLAEAAAVDVPFGSPAWLRRAAARLELLRLQRRPDDAAREVADLLGALRSADGTGIPPRRLVRIGVEALTACAPGQRADLLGLVVGELRRVSPAAARAVLLRRLGRVAELSGPGTDALVAELQAMVRGADQDPAQSAADRALLTLTLAELDRLGGWQAEAEAALAFVRDAVPSPIARRAWWSALDRLGPPLGRTAPRPEELAALAAGTAGLSLLAAAFLVERAEAQRDVDAATARRLVQDGALRLAEAPERDTQWHHRLRRLQDDLLPRADDEGDRT